jgi:hypothetical protein
MRIQSIFRRPAALAGVLALGATLGLSSLTIVRAEHMRPANTCHKSGPCLTETNTNGAAAQLTSTNNNVRALYVYATNPGADGTDINGGYIGIIGRAPANSGLYPLVLTDSNATDLNWTDTSGDFYYAGSLIEFAKTRSGEQVASYGCQSTTHTLEDVGSARLMNGTAFVHLHRTFESAIELQADPYRVFLTPNGDTRGLYIAQKLTNGFIVRESEKGRSNVDFDYRVVATALGHAGERMGVTPLPQAPRAPLMR